MLAGPVPLRLPDIPGELRALIAGNGASVVRFLAGITALLALAELSSAPQFLAAILISVVGQGLFLERLLADRLGATRTGQGEMFLALALSGFLAFFPILFGMALFVLPGALLLGSWAVAGPVIVAEGKNGLAALGESWRLTGGSRVQLMLLFALIIVLSIGTGGLIGLFPLLGTGQGSSLAERLAFDAMSAVIYVFNWLLAAALYRLLKPRGGELHEVFS